MHGHLRDWCFLIACLGTETANPFGAGLDWEGSNVTSRCLGLQKLSQLCCAVGKPPCQFIPWRRWGCACREFSCLPPLTLHLNWSNWEQGPRTGMRSWLRVVPAAEVTSAAASLQSTCMGCASAGSGQRERAVHHFLSPGVCEESVLVPELTVSKRPS